MSAYSPPPAASDHSFVTFLRQRYDFQEGDTWEFELRGTVHAGTLRIHSSQVCFAHTRESKLADSPNKLYKALNGTNSNMGGPHYLKLIVHFRKARKSPGGSSPTSGTRGIGGDRPRPPQPNRHRDTDP